MAAKRFTIELERVGKTATMFRVPFDLKVAFEWVEEANAPRRGRAA